MAIVVLSDSAIHEIPEKIGVVVLAAESQFGPAQSPREMFEGPAMVTP